MKETEVSSNNVQKAKATNEIGFVQQLTYGASPKYEYMTYSLPTHTALYCLSLDVGLRFS